MTIARLRDPADGSGSQDNQSSTMVYKYKRQVSLHQELKLGPLSPLDEAIPELAAEAAKVTL